MTLEKGPSNKRPVFAWRIKLVLNNTHVSYMFFKFVRDARTRVSRNKEGNEEVSQSNCRLYAAFTTLDEA